MSPGEFIIIGLLLFDEQAPFTRWNFIRNTAGAICLGIGVGIYAVDSAFSAIRLLGGG